MATRAEKVEAIRSVQTKIMRRWLSPKEIAEFMEKYRANCHGTRGLRRQYVLSKSLSRKDPIIETILVCNCNKIVSSTLPR